MWSGSCKRSKAYWRSCSLSSQNSYPLYDQSGITYTIGYFNPPCDVNFDGIGVTPDILVEEITGKDAPLEKAYEKALEYAKVNNGTEINLGAAA